MGGDHSPMSLPRPVTFDHGDFDSNMLTERRGDTTISVCLPARDEAATIGAIVERIHRRLVTEVPLVDEILVVDDGSTDQTARIAADAGARVVEADDELGDESGDCAIDGSGAARPSHGKGKALATSLRLSTGDLVAWCDADLVDFDERFIVGTLGPLVCDPELVFVKGTYARPSTGAGEGGGRVTELTARPAIGLLLPHLSGFDQPLSGEFAGRRSALEKISFVADYGVDLALLIDMVELFGVDRVVQVDLGSRIHRNRPLAELRPQAIQVLRVALERVGIETTIEHGEG